MLLALVLAVGALVLAALVWRGGAGGGAPGEAGGAGTAEGGAVGPTDGTATGAPPTTAGDPAADPASDGPPTLGFLGDSLTVGVGAPPGRGYAWQTAELLGWPIAVVDGVSGSGFLVPGGGLPMPERVPAVVAARPDVVVVAGGTNDAFQGQDPAAVQDAAAGLLADLRAGLPDATVVVVGPFPWTPDSATDGDAISAAVRTAAEEAGVAFLDPRDLFTSGRVDPATVGRYLSPDGVHPDEEGYALLAEVLAEQLGRLVPVP